MAILALTISNEFVFPTNLDVDDFQQLARMGICFPTNFRADSTHN